MKHTTIAVDLAKSVFEISVSYHPGAVSEHYRLSRAKFLHFFANRPPATVLLEATGSAHHWARCLNKMGHRPILLPPQHVRSYVVRNKTDRADTKALLEAYRNSDIHSVPVKSIEQQTLASLHRFRSAWMAARTARINGVRGCLREIGVFIPLGAHHVRPTVAALLEDADSCLPEVLRPVLYEACSEIAQFESRIRDIDSQLKALAKQLPNVQRLQTIPGIGLITATALVCFIGDAYRFPTGRRFASYVGLTPRERSSGNIRRLGNISKRGDVYIRMLLIHGARSVLRAAKTNRNPDRLRTWALKLESSRGHNKAAVALANKMARIAWVVLTRHCQFQPTTKAA